MSDRPILCRWDGRQFTPVNNYWANVAWDQFGEGGICSLVAHEERSDATHAHQFAWLREAWLQLPETIADQYPSPTHLRKRALIQAGFYNEEIIDVGSKAGAIRVAASLRGIDDFALVLVRGPFVIRRVAKSQSRRAMNKQEFAASKSAIMEVIAGLIGVAPDQLGKAA